MIRKVAVVTFCAVSTLGLVACGGDSDGASAAEYCELQSDFDQLSVTFSGLQGAFDGLATGDTAGAKVAFNAIYEALAEGKQLINDTRDRAPDEIADDFDVVADAFGDVFDALPPQAEVDAAIDANDLGALQALFTDFTTVSEEIGSRSEVQVASGNLSEYTSTNCDAATSTTPAATTAVSESEGDDSAG